VALAFFDWKPRVEYTWLETLWFETLFHFDHGQVCLRSSFHCTYASDTANESAALRARKNLEEHVSTRVPLLADANGRCFVCNALSPLFSNQCLALSHIPYLCEFSSVSLNVYRRNRIDAAAMEKRPRLHRIMVILRTVMATRTTSSFQNACPFALPFVCY
jgi:hypothetical protein